MEAATIIYDDHIAFDQQNKISIGKKEIEEFNNLYLTQSFLYNQESLELKNYLDKIFKKIHMEISIERQHLFIDELKKYSKRILSEDLDFFSKKKKSFEVNSEFEKKRFYTGKIEGISLKLIQWLSSYPVKIFRSNIKKGKLKREDLQINSGIIIRIIIFILNWNLKRRGLLKKLSEFYGEEYFVNGCALELSHEKCDWWKHEMDKISDSPKTLYFHYDEGLSYPKAMLYLTDVNFDSGPLSISKLDEKDFNPSPIQKIIGRAIQYVGKRGDSKLKETYNHKYHKTFGCKLFRKDFSILPKEMQFNSHFGWDVLPNSSLEKLIIKNENIVTGEKGTLVVFDGSNVLHRGGMVRKGERVVLQIILARRK
tara:strand:- start:1659 stop:2762 length:1104 start_codon:yes stop_codon:yes gene_type:complete